MDKYNKKALETLHDSKSRGLTGIQIHEEANNQKVVSKNKKRNFGEFQSEMMTDERAASTKVDTIKLDSKNKKFKANEANGAPAFSKGKYPSKSKMESKSKTLLMKSQPGIVFELPAASEKPKIEKKETQHISKLKRVSEVSSES